MGALDNVRKNIKELLNARGRSISAFARDIHMGQPLLHAYLSGKSAPGIEQLEKMANALEVSLTDLFGDQTPELPPLQLSDLKLAAIARILTLSRAEDLDGVIEVMDRLLDSGDKKRKSGTARP